jgi:hypothetical protein
MKKILLTTIALLMSASVNASLSTDFTLWEAEGDGTWRYSAASERWTQSKNGQPTVLFDPNSEALGSALSGDIIAHSSTDDDYIGFVLGYNKGDITKNNDEPRDFWLVDWKKGDQGSASKGLKLTHVESGTGSYWNNVGNAFTTIARGKNYGNRGWSNHTRYTFDIVYDSNLIELFINNTLELSVTASQAGVERFLPGGFGFYNFSQDNVSYGGISVAQAQDIASPAGKTQLTSVSSPLLTGLLAFPLLLLGFRKKS